MITEIRNKIEDVLSANATTYYQIAPSDASLPYNVFSFYSNPRNLGDTKDLIQDVYFQVSCYQPTDDLVESLADSNETALSVDLSTTNYKAIGFDIEPRVPYPIEVDATEKRLIQQFRLKIKG